MKPGVTVIQYGFPHPGLFIVSPLRGRVALSGARLYSRFARYADAVRIATGYNDIASPRLREGAVRVLTLPCGRVRFSTTGTSPTYRFVHRGSD